MKQIIAIIVFVICYSMLFAQSGDPNIKYEEVQKYLQTGWGTFNHKSVMSHVLLPKGFAMNIGIKLQDNTDNYLKETLISSRGSRPEKIIPGYKAFDGSYSELTIEWNRV